MAEEVEDAAITVPRSMITTVVLNGMLGYGFLVAILFSVGNVDTALSTPTTYPIIEIFHQATESKAGTNAMCAVLVAMAVFATIGVMASSSRLTWAFARDKGLPKSEFLAKLHERWRIPFNTVALTAIINIGLSLINIGSTAAFNAILSLSVVALYGTYITPIILMLSMRLRHPETISWGPFRMGRWGAAINVVSICYTIYASVFLLFPPVAATTAVNMNWTSLVCGSTILIALVAWWSGGTKRYKGPLKEI
jgi:choline transport protein